MIGINQSDLLQLKASDIDRVLTDIENFGFKSVRFAVDWGYLSNFLGSTNYAPVRAVAKVFADHPNLTPMPCLGIHYPWIHSASAFGNFVAKCTDIFGELPYYEVWNEPNLFAFNIGGPANYLKYLNAAAPHIRRIGAGVISGGLAAMPTWASNIAPVNWMQKIETSASYDVLGYHPYSVDKDQYSTFKDPRLNPFGMDQYSQLKKMYPTTRFGLTEVGFDTSKVSLTDAGNWLGYQLSTFDKRDHVWLFCWRDTPGDGGKYGLVDKNNTPKRQYYDVVKQMIPGA